MENSSSYWKAYEHAQRELKDLLVQQEKLETRIVIVRQSLQTLASLCESQDSTPEAEYLLENSALPDEILSILRAVYPSYHRATIIKTQLERLGHDMTKYQNPLATIHMILKRLVDAGKVETGTNKAAEKLYRAPRVSDALSLHLGFQSAERSINDRERLEKSANVQTADTKRKEE